MTKVFSKEEKQSIKQLFHGALDFMNERNDERTIKEYIKICKEQITVSGITIFEFNEWVEEWEVKKA
jgi:hypothetical protein